MDIVQNNPEIKVKKVGFLGCYIWAFLTILSVLGSINFIFTVNFNFYYKILFVIFDILTIISAVGIVMKKNWSLYFFYASQIIGIAPLVMIFQIIYSSWSFILSLLSIEKLVPIKIMVIALGAMVGFVYLIYSIFWVIYLNKRFYYDISKKILFGTLFVSAVFTGLSSGYFWNSMKIDSFADMGKIYNAVEVNLENKENVATDNNASVISDVVIKNQEWTSYKNNKYKYQLIIPGWANMEDDANNFGRKGSYKNPNGDNSEVPYSWSFVSYEKSGGINTVRGVIGTRFQECVFKRLGGGISIDGILAEKVDAKDNCNHAVPGKRIISFIVDRGEVINVFECSSVLDDRLSDGYDCYDAYFAKMLSSIKFLK